MLSHLNYYWNEMTMGRMAFLVWNIVISLILPFVFVKEAQALDSESSSLYFYVKSAIVFLVTDSVLRIIIVRARVRDFDGNVSLWTGLGTGLIISFILLSIFPDTPLALTILFLLIVITWVTSLLCFLFRRGNQFA